MRTLLLSWGIIWRMSLWGLGAGLLLGCGYGVMFLPLFAAIASDGTHIFRDAFFFPIYSAPIGAVGGLLLGTVDGFLIAVATFLIPGMQLRSRQYRLIARAICLGVVIVVIVWTFCGTAYLQTWTGLLLDSNLMAFILLPGIIAVVASWFATVRITEWLEWERFINNENPLY